MVHIPTLSGNITMSLKCFILHKPPQCAHKINMSFFYPFIFNAVEFLLNEFLFKRAVLLKEDQVTLSDQSDVKNSVALH